MKRIILLILTCLPLWSTAQEQELLDKYASIDGCSTIELSKEMIRSMGGGDGIDTLSAISLENRDLIDEFTNDVEVYTKGMTKILSVAQNSQRVKIYCIVDADSENITKMVIHTTDNNTSVMVILTGKDIELSSASSIMSIEL